MRHAFRILVAALLVTSLVKGAVRAQNPTPTSIPNGLPEWAYNIPDKVQPPEPRVPATVRAAGSSREYEASAIAGNANPPDWFPDEHPPAPPERERPDAERVRVVPPDVGPGTPRVRRHRGHAGRIHRPADEVFKSGARKEEGRMGPIARAVSDEDVNEAAAYFAALTPAPFVKVLEAATPPKTYISADARHRRIHPDGGTGPIGRRIIQVPEDPKADDDPGSAFGVRRVRAARQHRGGRGAGEGGRRGQDDSVRAVPRRRAHGAGRSAAHRGPAAGLHRAPAHYDAERHERRRQRGADEEGGREVVGRRYHRALGIYWGRFRRGKSVNQSILMRWRN